MSIRVLPSKRLTSTDGILDKAPKALQSKFLFNGELGGGFTRFEVGVLFVRTCARMLQLIHSFVSCLVS